MELKRAELKKQYIKTFTDTYHCVECNIPFIPCKVIGNYRCKYHPLPLIAEIGDKRNVYECCKWKRGSKGCTPCDHHDTKPLNVTPYSIPLFFFKEGYIRK